MTPTEKADLIERSSQYLERLFQAGVIPADTLLNGVRNSQLDVGITSTITDDNIESVKGKYIKDISPQADPFGGMFQGGESEEGNETENSDMINPINKVPEKSTQSHQEVPEKSTQSHQEVPEKSTQSQPKVPIKF
jgi:hypothetical protein